MHFILCFSADRQPLLRRITMVFIFQAPQPAAAATPRPRLRPERESPRLRNQAPEYGLDALDQLRERARVARMVQLVAAQAEDAAADEDVEEIPPWTCQTCNTLNDHDESRCTQCNAWRMAPPTKPAWDAAFLARVSAKNKGWQCGTCLSFTANMAATHCATCNTPRED